MIGDGERGKTLMKKVVIILSLLLIAGSVLGMVHGTRAALSLVNYYQTKYRDQDSGEDPIWIARRADDAFTCYEYNYYYCIYAAEKCYYQRLDERGVEIPERIEESVYWCDKGLSLNPYKSQLRRLKVRFLRRESVQEAVEYWEDFVEWSFWDPYHHAVLVELYAEAGDFGKAMDSLTWVAGTTFYDDAKKKVDEAWQREMVFEDAGPQGR